ncbi:MAG: type II/IV secretion system protein [Magnetococcales bacterium]|nr:type II/IV secretion system protein [Magnetococcales bacterium]
MLSRDRVGEHLLALGEIDAEQLQRALTAQAESGEKLGAVLVRLRIMDESRFLHCLAAMLRVPLIDLQTVRMDSELVRLLPESAARRHQALVLARTAEGLLVGLVDPTDILACDEVRRLLGGRIRWALLAPSLLPGVLDRCYQGVERVQEQVTVLHEALARSAFHLDGVVQSEQLSDAPVAQILLALFEDAVRLNASDIHIEPDYDVLRLRRRIDGVLQEQVVPERRIATALVSKLKLMAGLEIAERRLPQDGRFELVVRGRMIDVRLSTLPVSHGEAVVLRLLDRSKEHAALESVLEPELLQRFQAVLHRLHGLVLVTGPTGSGKTTTLYGALHRLNTSDRKIITVEDPVEYRLPRISQVAIQPRIGLDFSSILRTVLRQDPDVILVGEMRDRETAELAVRAALTGHLVFSTLHTNSAVGAAVRLLEMGLPGYAVAAALRCLVAQRLVRRNCPACAEPLPLTPAEQAILRHLLADPQGTPLRGRGCAHCHFTGYAGRMAVVEMLEIEPELADALRRQDLAEVVRIARLQPGYIPLHQVALRYALQGRTTLEEALRLVESEEYLPGWEAGSP